MVRLLGGAERARRVEAYPRTGLRRPLKGHVAVSTKTDATPDYPCNTGMLCHNSKDDSAPPAFTAPRPPPEYPTVALIGSRQVGKTTLAGRSATQMDSVYPTWNRHPTWRSCPIPSCIWRTISTGWSSSMRCIGHRILSKRFAAS